MQKIKNQQEKRKKKKNWITRWFFLANTASNERLHRSPLRRRPSPRGGEWWLLSIQRRRQSAGGAYGRRHLSTRLAPPGRDLPRVSTRGAGLAFPLQPPASLPLG